MLAHGGLQIGHVLGLDRARRMVRKVAVEFEKQRNDFARQVFEDVRNRFAGHAVAGVDRDFERPDLRRSMNERQCSAKSSRMSAFVIVPGVRAAGRQVACAIRSRICRQARYRARSLALAARVNFMPLYCGGIVRCGDHHAAVEAVFADGEIQRVGRNQADIEHVGAGVGRAARERFEEGAARTGACRGRPRCAWLRATSRNSARSVGDVVVSSGRINPANVVRLEYSGFYRVCMAYTGSEGSISTPRG